MKDRDAWVKIPAMTKNSHGKSFDQANLDSKQKNSADRYAKKLSANNSMSAYNNIFITGTSVFLTTR